VTTLTSICRDAKMAHDFSNIAFINHELARGISMDCDLLMKPMISQSGSAK
jgi:hypothetical protein